MLPTPSNSSTYDIFFAYDHKGHRVRKELYDRNTSNLIAYTNYLYDVSGNLIEQFGEQLDSSSNWKFSYQQWVWHQGKAVLGERVYSDSSGAFGSQSVNFHTDDHIGKVVAATSVHGIPIWRSQNEPYGIDPGLSLQSPNAYQESLMSQTSPGNLELSPYSNNSTWQTTRSIVTPGTFGIQFYFEKLSLETGRDHLAITSKESSSVGDQVLHLFTGEHFTGRYNNPANPFWGPVLPFRPKSLTSSANAKSDLLFEVLSDSNTTWDGFKITKYRTWNIADGDVISYLKNDTPANPVTGVYEAYLGDSNYTPLKLPWERVYNDDPTATLRRVCFTGFHVENHYDYVEIRDASENIIQVMTGNLGDVCSTWVQSPSLKVQLYTDYSVEYAGFTVQRIETMRGTSIHARFPGQWYEPETEVRDSSNNLLTAGLHYNWHRYYDPNIGRYLTPDPLGLEAGMNLYAYAANDPVNNIDPEGLEEVQIHQWTLAGAIREKRNPHVGLLVKNKILEKIFFPTPSKDKPIIFVDKSPITIFEDNDNTYSFPPIRTWLPYFGTIYHASLFDASPYPYKANVWTMKTTFAQDVRVVEEGLNLEERCLQANRKNSYQGCQWILRGSNCEDWALHTLAKCGITSGLGPIGYVHLGRLFPSFNYKTYDWRQHLDNTGEYIGLRFLPIEQGVARKRLNKYHQSSLKLINSMLPHMFKISWP